MILGNPMGNPIQILGNPKNAWKSYKNPSLAPLRLVSVLASAPLRSAWGSEAGSGAPREDLRLPTISGSLWNC